MKIEESVYRFRRYYTEAGIWKTFHRLFTKLLNYVYQNQHLLHFADLKEYDYEEFSYPDCFKMEKIRDFKELSKKDMDILTGYLGDAVFKEHARSRFDKGATLWLKRMDGELVGYRWTIRGRSIKRPYFFPLTKNDVHLFDVVIFPQYRGKGLYPFSIEFVLKELKKDGVSRVFGEMKRWNSSVLRSASKTKMRKLGIARKIHVFGKDIVIWHSFFTFD